MYVSILPTTSTWKFKIVGELLGSTSRGMGVGEAGVGSRGVAGVQGSRRFKSKVGRGTAAS